MTIEVIIQMYQEGLICSGEFANMINAAVVEESCTYKSNICDHCKNCPVKKEI